MRYRVKVVLKRDFIEVSGDEITVGVRQAPEGGKANEELRKRLAKHFRVPVVNVRIVSGKTSRRKVVEVE